MTTGVSIKVTGATFTNYVSSLTLPDRTSLIAEYHFGTSNALSIVNHANVAAPATVIGTPTHSTYYSTIATPPTGTNGFNLGLASPANDVTFMVLVRKGTGFPAMLVSVSSTDHPTGFLDNSQVPAFYNGRYGDLTYAANASVPAHSDFFLMAGTGSNGNFGQLHIWTSGTRATTTAANSALAEARGTSNLQIGGSFTGGAGIGSADIAYAAVLGRKMTTTELDEAYASLKALYTVRGLTIS